MSKEVSFKKFLDNQSTNPIFSLVLVVIIYVFQTLLQVHITQHGLLR